MHNADSRFLSSVNDFYFGDGTPEVVAPVAAVKNFRVSPFRYRVKALPPRQEPQQSEEDVKAQLIAEILAGVFSEDTGDKSLFAWHSKAKQQHAVGVPYQTASGNWRELREFNGKLRSVPSKAPGGAQDAAKPGAKPKPQAAPKKPAQAKPAAVAKKPKPVKLDVATATARIDEMRKGGTSEEKLTAFVGELATMTVPQLKELQGTLGIKPKGNKPDLIAKVKEVIAEFAVPDDVEQIPDEDAIVLDDGDGIEMDDGESIVLDDEPVAPAPKPAPTPVAIEPTAELPTDNPAKDFKIIKPKGLDKQAEATLKKISQSYNWDKAQKDAAYYYTGSGYQSMNRMLRKGVSGDAMDTAAIKEIDRIMAEAPPIDPPVRVYRGMTLTNNDAYKYIAGIKQNAETNTPVTLGGYQSTSIVPSISEQFGAAYGKVGNLEKSIRFQIQAKRGVYLEGITDVPGEHEVLLPHGNNYAVGEIVEDEYGYIISMVQM